jgi:nicotinic acid phosphoribosyltransferase
MIFGTFCIVMGIHVFLMWLETCQKSLEEIELLFDGTVPAWRSASIKSRFDEEVEELQRGSTVKNETKLNENDGAHLEREDTLV